jgi:hypothetical protein
VSGETTADFQARVLVAASKLIDNIDDYAPTLENGHVLDAVIAAYTGWLFPSKLEPPPPGFAADTGWIWFPANRVD